MAVNRSQLGLTYRALHAKLNFPLQTRFSDLFGSMEKLGIYTTLRWTTGIIQQRTPLDRRSSTKRFALQTVIHAENSSEHIV
jgi:hypothetical protein